MRIADSTAVRFTTGSEPGRPRQTGQTWVFGSAPNSVGQPQNILLFVDSSTCTSSPSTGSKRSTTSAKSTSVGALIAETSRVGARWISGTSSSASRAAS